MMVIITKFRVDKIEKIGGGSYGWYHTRVDLNGTPLEVAEKYLGDEYWYRIGDDRHSRTGVFIGGHLSEEQNMIRLHDAYGDVLMYPFIWTGRVTTDPVNRTPVKVEGDFTSVQNKDDDYGHNKD